MQVLFPVLLNLLKPSSDDKYFAMRSGEFEMSPPKPKTHLDTEIGHGLKGKERSDFADLVFSLGVTHLDRGCINAGLFNGQHGNPGFLDFLERKNREQPAKSHPAQSTRLAVAFWARRHRAEMLVGSAMEKIAENDATASPL